MGESKFSKFALYVLIIGAFAALFMIINTVLHTSFGSYIPNKTLTPNEMMGPNAKY